MLDFNEKKKNQNPSELEMQYFQETFRKIELLIIILWSAGTGILISPWANIMSLSLLPTDVKGSLSCLVPSRNAQNLTDINECYLVTLLFISFFMFLPTWTYLFCNSPLVTNVCIFPLLSSVCLFWEFKLWSAHHCSLLCVCAITVAKWRSSVQ